MTADLQLSLEDLLNIKIVTAGAKEERALASANIFVVTRAEIEQHGYRSLVEVLANVPGLYVIDDLVTPSLAVRGISGGLGAGTRIVRMMIDGAQVNFRPDLTAFLGPEYIPMEAVERVEIAKGPLSALYGANAFLATVNVITRLPRDGVTAEVAARSSWTRFAASPGTSGLVAFKEGRTSFLSAFALNHVDRSGFELEQTFRAQDNTPQLFGTRSEKNLARPQGVFLSLQTGSDRLGSLALAGGLQQMDAMGEFQVNSLLTHRHRLAIQNTWASARWERPWSTSGNVAVTLGAAQGSPTSDTSLYLTESRSSMYVPNYSYRALNGGAYGEWTPGQKLSLRLGFDGELDHEHVLYYTQVFNVPVGAYQPDDRVDVAIGGGDRRSELLTDLGLYLQAASTPFPYRLPGLRLTGNVRLDRITQGDIGFPLQASWRLAAAYRVSSSLYAKIVGGRAFQTPSGVLVFARPGFGSVGNIVGSATIAGTPSLRPQTVDSIELGASGILHSAFLLEGGIFFQRVQDQIEFVRYGANYRAANQGSVAAAGVEGVLRFSYRRFSTYFGGCLQRTIEDGSFASEPPASFPNAFGQLGASLAVPELRFQANGELRLVSTRGASRGNISLNNGQFYTLPAYSLLNLTISSVGLHLLGQSTETRLLVGMRNLLDIRFSEPGHAGFDIPTLGRVFVMELRQIFRHSGPVTIEVQIFRHGQLTHDRRRQQPTEREDDMTTMNRLGTLLGGALLATLGCSSDEGSIQQTKVITLGGVIDQTGSAGPPSWSNAAQLAVTQMNSALVQAKSEIRFNLVLADSTNQPAVAVQRAQDLVRIQGAKGLVVDTSQDDVAILKLQYDPDVAQHLDVPLVGLVATSPSINNPATTNPDPVTQAAYRDAEHWNFRTAMSSVAQGLALTNILMGKLNKPSFKVSVLASDEPFGNGQVAALKAALSSLAPSAIVETIKFSTTDHTVNDADFFFAQMGKLLDQHNEETGTDDGPPDAWMGLTFPDYLVAMIKAYKLSGSALPGVHGMGLRNQKVLDSLGSDANGQEGTSYVVVDTGVSGARFAADMAAATGLPPNSLDSATYDATATLMLAALAAASGQPDPTAITGAQIRAAMRGTSDPLGQMVGAGASEFATAAGLISQGLPINYEGAQSPCDFDESGSVATRFIHFVIANGVFQDMQVYDCVASPTCPVQL